MNRLGGLIRRLPWTAALLPDRLPGHRRAASAERLRQRMAPLPVPAARHRRAGAPGGSAHDAGRRGPRAHRRARRGRLREGLRDHVPGHSAVARGRARPRGTLSMRVGMGILAVACAGLGWPPCPSCQRWPPSSLATRGWRHRPPRSAPACRSPCPGRFGADVTDRWWRWGWLVVTGGVWLAVRVFGEGRRSAWTRRGAAGGSSRRRGWNTRRPPSPSPCAACSPGSTGRPRTSRSTSIRSRRYFVQSIEYRSEIVPWFERYLYAPLIARMRSVGHRYPRRSSRAPCMPT